MSESRYPQPKEPGKCIGCNADLPRTKRGRPYQYRTWCSKKCRIEHCGLGFQGYVKKRALGYCEMCSMDLLVDYANRLEMQTADIWEWDCRVEGYIHHIIPYAQGGAHNVSNLQLLCSLCHKEAHKKLRGQLIQTKLFEVKHD
jgi:hypothetical protein